MRAEAGLLWKRLVGLSLDRAVSVEFPSTAWFDRALESAEVSRHVRAEIAADSSYAIPLSDRLRGASSVRIVVPDELAPVRPELVDAVLEYVTAFAPTDASVRALVLPTQGFDAWSGEGRGWPDHLVRLASWEIPIDTSPATLGHLYPPDGARPLAEDEVVIHIARPYRGSRYRISDPNLRLAAFSVGPVRMREELSSNAPAWTEWRAEPPYTDEPDGRSHEGVFCVYETNRPQGYRVVVGSPRHTVVECHKLLRTAFEPLSGRAAAFVFCADERKRHLSEIARMFTMVMSDREEFGYHYERMWWAEPRRIVVIADLLPLRPFDRLLCRVIWEDPSPIGPGGDGQHAYIWDEDWWLTDLRSPPRPLPGGMRVDHGLGQMSDQSIYALPTFPVREESPSHCVVLSRCGRTFGTLPGYVLGPEADLAEEALRFALLDDVPVTEKRPLVLARGVMDAELFR